MHQTAPAIAVIDDDASVRRALQRLLRSVGFAVETFATAREFLDAGRLSQTTCLVLDIHLPEMTGFELEEHLAISGSRLPIVFITAHDDGPMRERASRAGAIGYLRKPFDQEALIEAIVRAIGWGAPRQEIACGASDDGRDERTPQTPAGDWDEPTIREGRTTFGPPQS
jgi:FixJ family two-component response regulator